MPQNASGANGDINYKDCFDLSDSFKKETNCWSSFHPCEANRGPDVDLALDLDDFIFLSDNEKDGSPDQKEPSYAVTLETANKLSSVELNSYNSPGTVARDKSMSEMYTRSSLNFGAKPYLDSEYRSCNTDINQFEATKTSEIRPQSLSHDNSSKELLDTAQQLSPKYPCFNSEKIARNEDLKRRKRHILGYSLPTNFQPKHFSEPEKLEPIKKQGRIYKIINNFRSRQKVTQVDSDSDTVSLETETSGEITPSESYSLRRGSKNGSYSSFFAGTERQTSGSLFRMPNALRTPSGSVSSSGTAVTLNEQNHKTDVDLAINDANLAFRVAQSLSHGGHVLARQDPTHPEQ